MNHAAYFQQLYQQPDPFGYRDRWYEARKRALTLASLPQARYARAWELGCSNGVTTAELAPRCDALLATDLSHEALATAAVGTAAFPQVRLMQAEHPREWPPGHFDLIVVSEVGYYLGAEDLQQLALKLDGSLAPGGLLVACHWRHPFAEARSSTEEVHQALGQARPAAFTYTDADFLLQGWTHAVRSVAQREGLR